MIILFGMIFSHTHYAEIRDIVIVLTECVESDQTLYNSNVDEIVAEHLRSEHNSDRHKAIIIRQWSEIENA